MGGEERDLASGATVDVLVPCDVAGLTAVAQTLRGHAAALDTAGASLSRVEVASWRGSAATGFATAIEPEPGRWRTASDAFLAGAVAVEGFVASVQPARLVALDAVVLYRRYVALTAAAAAAAGVVTELPGPPPSPASSVADRMRVGARIDQLQRVAAEGGAAAAMVAEAESLRRQAISTLASARRTVRAAGDCAAAALAAAVVEAPEARRFWEANIRPAGAEGFVHGTLDGLGWVPGPLGMAASGINAAWYLAEGRRTEAGLSAAGMVWVGKGAKLAKGADDVVAGGGDAARAFHDPGSQAGWLSSHEIDGSHTILEHVGRSDEELLERVTDPTHSIKGASTFVSLRDAEVAVNDALRLQVDRIATFMANPDKCRTSFVTDLGRVVGRGVRLESSAFQDLTAISVFVVKDTRFPSGYRVWTAFPSPGVT